MNTDEQQLTEVKADNVKVKTIQQDEWKNLCLKMASGDAPSCSFGVLSLKNGKVLVQK
jgi:hypothetical protein